jgi:hypothetical protein
MMDFGFELSPGVKQKLERMRPMMSPQQYETLREKVQDRVPEYLEKELDRMGELAEFILNIDMDPELKFSAKQKMKDYFSDQGFVSVSDADLTQEVQDRLTRGDFDLAICDHPSTGIDVLCIVLDDGTQIPLQDSFAQTIVADLKKS